MGQKTETALLSQFSVLNKILLALLFLLFLSSFFISKAFSQTSLDLKVAYQGGRIMCTWTPPTGYVLVGGTLVNSSNGAINCGISGGAKSSQGTCSFVGTGIYYNVWDPPKSPDFDSGKYVCQVVFKTVSGQVLSGRGEYTYSNVAPPPVSLLPNGSTCSSNSQCLSAYCSPAGVCEDEPTTKGVTPVVTITPTSGKNCTYIPLFSKKDNTCTCSSSTQCASNNCSTAADSSQKYCCGAGKSYCGSTGKCITTGTTCGSSVPPPACQLKTRGDANCDGFINTLDLNSWRSEFLNPGSLSADFNADNLVNTLDLNTWRTGFLDSSLQH